MRTSTTAAGRTTTPSAQLVPAAKFSGCGVRGTALRIRHGRHLRRNESAERNVCTIAGDARHHRLQRAVGDGSGFIRRGSAQRSIRTAPLPRAARRLISGFFRRLCLRLELGRPDCVSRNRRIGHWRIISDWANVHRRNLTGCQAWTSGRAFQMNVVVGILLAYLSNSLVASVGFGESEWRWKFGMVAIPAAAFLFALFGIPESPRWLIAVGRMEEAREVFERVGERNPERDLHEIEETLKMQSGIRREPLFQSRYRKPIFLAISIGMFNQLSGINAILYYLNDIFERAGFNKVSSDMQAVVIGFTNLVFTLIAMSMIDRLGRKKLLLAGAVGTAVSLAGVAMIFATGKHPKLLLWLLVGFIASFAFSQGAVIWVYLSEVFPNLVRAKGQSLGSFTHWFMNALISAVFPVMAARSGAVPFVLFAVMMVVQFFVVLTLYPETKGVSLEKMEQHL